MADKRIVKEELPEHPAHQINFFNTQAQSYWESILLPKDMTVFQALLEKFQTIPPTVSHLITVHNEACGCQVGSNHETDNMIWNQKKVAFLELQKQSGLDFDDYLNRALRLLICQDIHQIQPISERDFWIQLRSLNNTPYPEVNQSGVCSQNNIEEDLKDINLFIAKDMGGEANLIASPSSVSETSNSLRLSSDHEEFSEQNDEDLIRKKRTEKHMAPIDCTGVAPAFNLRWNCKPCEKQHISKYDCNKYKKLYHPDHTIQNSNDQRVRELPSQLERKEDGIYTSLHILAYTKLGPLKGREFCENDMDFDEDKSNIWLLYCENGTRKCIVASDDQSSNWLKEVTPANSASDANVFQVSIQNEIFLVSTADIPPNTKLKYFSKEDPSTEFWTSWTQAWANQTKCTRCSIHGHFSNVAEYRVHISLWHDLSFHGNPQNRIYYCPDCGLRCIGAKEVIQHCREHHDTLPFKCRHCSRRFESYNSLGKHKNRIHVKEKPLRKPCTYCGKIYLDPKALKQHVRQVHEKSDQLHCIQCEFIFSSKYALNRHVKEVHNRQQEHTCPKCNKMFTQFSNLKQHMLIHIGAKPFSCEHENCPSAFTTKQCLQVHYKKVHNYTADNMPAIKRKPIGEFDLTREGSGNSSDNSMDLTTSQQQPIPMSSNQLSVNNRHQMPIIPNAATLSGLLPRFSSGLRK